MIFSGIVQIRSTFDFDLRCSSCKGNDNEEVQGTSSFSFRPQLSAAGMYAASSIPGQRLPMTESKSVTFSLISFGNGFALFSMEIKIPIA